MPVTAFFPRDAQPSPGDEEALKHAAELTLRLARQTQVEVWVGRKITARPLRRNLTPSYLLLLVQAAPVARRARLARWGAVLAGAATASLNPPLAPGSRALHWASLPLLWPPFPPDVKRSGRLGDGINESC